MEMFDNEKIVKMSSFFFFFFFWRIKIRTSLYEGSILLYLSKILGG